MYGARRMGMRPPGTPQYSGAPYGVNISRDEKVQTGSVIATLILLGILYHHRDELKQSMAV